jgi:hypothetical protein
VAERVLAQASVLYRAGMEPGEVAAEVREKLPPPVDGYDYDIHPFRPPLEGWEDAALCVEVDVRWRQSGQSRAERFHTILLPHPRLGAAAE